MVDQHNKLLATANQNNSRPDSNGAHGNIHFSASCWIVDIHAVPRPIPTKRVQVPGRHTMRAVRSRTPPHGDLLVHETINQTHSENQQTTIFQHPGTAVAFVVEAHLASPNSIARSTQLLPSETRPSFQALETVAESKQST